MASTNCTPPRSRLEGATFLSSHSTTSFPRSSPASAFFTTNALGSCTLQSVTAHTAHTAPHRTPPHLASVRVGYAHDGHIGDGWVVQQLGFQFCRRHLEA